MVKVIITCAYATNTWIKFSTAIEKWIENNYEWAQFVLKQLSHRDLFSELSDEREMEIKK